MRILLRLFALAVTTVLGALLLATPASATTPYCGITWGSQPVAYAGYSSPEDYIGTIRSGQHGCYDRLVIDLGNSSGFKNYSVRYVARVREDGSGRVVPLRGAARLELVLASVPYDAQGRPTYTPPSRTDVVNVAGYRTFRQVAWAGAFEGQTTLGIGVRARLPLRAFVLDGPGHDTRLIIDVAHRW
jgi:hypothetical protein